MLKFFIRCFDLFIVWKATEKLNGNLFAFILGASCVLFSAHLRINTLLAYSCIKSCKIGHQSKNKKRNGGQEKTLITYGHNKNRRLRKNVKNQIDTSGSYCIRKKNSSTQFAIQNIWLALCYKVLFIFGIDH